MRNISVFLFEKIGKVYKMKVGQDKIRIRQTQKQITIITKMFSHWELQKILLVTTHSNPTRNTRTRS